MTSPILQILGQLLRAPDPPAEKMFVRIRLMERDIMLPVKVITLSFLFFLLPDYTYFLGPELAEAEFIPEDSIETLTAQLKAQTVRDAFIGYLLFNLVVAASFVAMMSLPFRLVEAVVYLTIITDAVFAAILVNLTGDIESLFYWVFLFIIVRTAVSVPRHREQLILYAAVIVCYIIGPVFGRTLENIARQVDEPTTILPVVVPESATNAADQLQISNQLNAFVEVLTASNIVATPTPDGSIAISTEELTLLELVLTSLLQVTEPEDWQEKFVRIVVLCLLSVCCYGINVLWNYQVLTREEEQEFAARQNQLRSTGRLAAEIAHQLKNPLAIINNAAFSLTRALKESPPAIHDKIAMIKEEVERSDRILTELMGYAKLAEGRVEKLDLRTELDKAIAQVFPPAFEQNIRVSVDCPEHFPPMLMQQTHLSEILVNILINAREALNGEGWIEIQAQQTGEDRVTLTFRDNGPGLSEQRLEQIFEPYYSTKERGTGLGLAIVKHNVEIYGGSVRAESKLGNGTKFTLEFPFKVIAPVKS